MSRGGMVVVGRVTGTHLLEDIRVAVPFQVAVTLTAEQVYRSKDLYVALQQGLIFKLKDFREAPSGGPPPTVPDKELRKLREDNQKLQDKLDASTRETAELRSAVSNQKGQLDAIQAAIEALSQGGQLVGAVLAEKLSNEAVGGETPMFLPELTSTATETSVRAKTQVTESARVNEAATALRALRKGKK